jgi:hypothetical protein
MTTTTAMAMIISISIRDTGLCVVRLTLGAHLCSRLELNNSQIQ